MQLHLYFASWTRGTPTGWEQHAKILLLHMRLPYADEIVRVCVFVPVRAFVVVRRLFSPRQICGTCSCVFSLPSCCSRVVLDVADPTSEKRGRGEKKQREGTMEKRNDGGRHVRSHVHTDFCSSTFIQRVGPVATVILWSLLRRAKNVPNIVVAFWNSQMFVFGEEELWLCCLGV